MQYYTVHCRRSFEMADTEMLVLVHSKLALSQKKGRELLQLQLQLKKQSAGIRVH